MRSNFASIALIATMLATSWSATEAQVALPPAAKSGACESKAIDGGDVRAVLDGRTVALTDGREIRLAAIETPAAEPQRAEAVRALERLLSGRTVALWQARPETDRYGRPIAFVFLPDTDSSVQHLLLAEGLARVAASVGRTACAAELLAAEAKARTASLGLWGDPDDSILQAEEPSEVLAQRGRFTLVEGRVRSVREFRSVIYVNFGRRWSEDFTVTVLKRSEKTFAAAGLDLKTLTGKTVRVRGFVEERGGPWIEATAPEQIEIAE